MMPALEVSSGLEELPILLAWARAWAWAWEAGWLADQMDGWVCVCIGAGAGA